MPTYHSGQAKMHIKVCNWYMYRQTSKTANYCAHTIMYIKLCHRCLERLLLVEP